MDIQKIKESLQTPLIAYNPFVHGITQSVLTTWHSCEKKARYSLSGLYKAGDSAALTFGSVFHDFQECVLESAFEEKMTAQKVTYNIKSISNFVYKNKWEEKYIKASATGKENITYAFSFMQSLIPEYFNYYSSDLFGGFKKWVEVEGEFKVLINGIPYRGRRDGVYQSEEDGKLYLMEHKTKARFNTEAVTKMIPYNFQVLAYVMAYFLEHGVWLHGVCYNIVRKPELRQKISESTTQFIARCMEDIKKRPQYYFIRVKHDFKIELLEQFHKMFGDKLNNFVLWAGQDPKEDFRNTTQCESAYGMCAYVEYCSSNGADRSMLEVKTNIFEELSPIK